MTYGTQTKGLAPYYLLFFFFLLGFALRLSFGARPANRVHPDEIFQTLEPAHRLAYGYGVVTWEWRQGVRSWVFPAVLAAIMRATDWTGPGSSGYLSGVSIVLSLLSLTTIWFGFAWAKRAFGIDAAIVAACACATWYGLVLFAPRPLNEVLAADLFLPGLYLGAYPDGPQEKRRLFLGAVLCGLALSFRVQLAPAVIFAGLYFCRSSWRARLPIVVSGILLPVCIFGLVDGFTWHHPFQSFYLYVWVNLVQGKSTLYGVEPWYWYLLQILRELGPIATLALLGAWRSPFLGWISLIILASHSMLQHKEMRFLYPLLPVVIILAAIGLVDLLQQINATLKAPLSQRALVAASVAALAGASYHFSPQFPYWLKESGSLTAFEDLSRDSRMCGVGLYEVTWFDVGGYTYLHRDVPIFLVLDRASLDREAAYFDVLLHKGLLNSPPQGFSVEECENGFCIYRRRGFCAPSEEPDINSLFSQIGL